MKSKTHTVTIINEFMKNGVKMQLDSQGEITGSYSIAYGNRDIVNRLAEDCHSSTKQKPT